MNVPIRNHATKIIAIEIMPSSPARSRKRKSGRAPFPGRCPSSQHLTVKIAIPVALEAIGCPARSISTARLKLKYIPVWFATMTASIAGILGFGWQCRRRWYAINKQSAWIADAVADWLAAAGLDAMADHADGGHLFTASHNLALTHAAILPLDLALILMRNKSSGSSLSAQNFFCFPFSIPQLCALFNKLSIVKKILSANSTIKFRCSESPCAANVPRICGKEPHGAARFAQAARYWRGWLFVLYRGNFRL